MSQPEQPWYVAGLAFACQSCGRCCAGPEEGYVFIDPGEVAAAAAFLHMPLDEFQARYVRLAYRRFSIIEHPQTHDCIFLADSDGAAARGCAIYPVRPAQCRTWPFWVRNLRNQDDWLAAGNRCPGVNRGQLHGLEEIERKRNESGP
jgi:Fe-S-cluster containining protein